MTLLLGFYSHLYLAELEKKKFLSEFCNIKVDSLSKGSISIFLAVEDSEETESCKI